MAPRKATARPKLRSHRLSEHALKCPECRYPLMCDFCGSYIGTIDERRASVDRVTYQHSPETVTSC